MTLATINDPLGLETKEVSIIYTAPLYTDSIIPNPIHGQHVITSHNTFIGDIKYQIKCPKKQDAMAKESI